MREIEASLITKAVRDACIKANLELPPCLKERIENARA